MTFCQHVNAQIILVWAFAIHKLVATKAMEVRQMYASSSDRYDYRVRLQPPKHTRDAILLTYLRRNQHPHLDHHEMVLMALRSFWLPIAYNHHIQQGAEVSEREFKHLVRTSMTQLRDQSASFQEQFLFNNAG
jgi:hypothetical protein